MDNTIIVIFGASGDLARRKLLPALHRLFINGLLPEDFAIIGTGRSPYKDETFRHHILVRQNKKEKNTPEKDNFYNHLYYQQADTEDKGDIVSLKKRITELGQKHKTNGNILYYLATPPRLYMPITELLATHGMDSGQTAGNGWKRLIIEKPFGDNLQSAKELDSHLHKFFDEEQIFRIDHYLGKETVQNLLVFRFSNAMFEPLWNRNFIDHVEITAAESLGIEQRGGYYDQAGAVRDMLQNHLLQMLSMMAMEPPTRINAHAIRDEALKVMQSFRPITSTDLKENLVLGQYTESTIRGKFCSAYRNEPGVAATSRTETFVALKMFIDNWRWQGVPFYLRTGKRLPTRATEIVVYLKKTPHLFFAHNAPENKIIIRIQPDEGILINFGLKKPGAGFQVREVGMDFHYRDLNNSEVLDAYERLLIDAINGDATLFARTDAVEACWEFIQPILDFKGNGGKLYGYAAGTWGPQEADQLLEKENRTWRFPCKNLVDTDYCEL